MRVPLSSIAFDAGTQVRAAINEQVVSEYAEADVMHEDPLSAARGILTGMLLAIPFWWAVGMWVTQ